MKRKIRYSDYGFIGTNLTIEHLSQFVPIHRNLRDTEVALFTQITQRYTTSYVTLHNEF